MLGGLDDLATADQKLVGFIKLLNQYGIANAALDITKLRNRTLPVDGVFSPDAREKGIAARGRRGVLCMPPRAGKTVNGLRISRHNTEGLLIAAFRIRISTELNEFVGLRHKISSAGCLLIRRRTLPIADIGNIYACRRLGRLTADLGS